MKIPSWAKYAACNGNTVIAFTSTLQEAYEQLRGESKQQVCAIVNGKLVKYRKEIQYGAVRNPERLLKKEYEAGHKFSMKLAEAQEGGGMGLTGNQKEWEYFGFAALMLPSVFRRLARYIRFSDSDLDRLTEGLAKGYKMAPPFLKFSRNEGKGNYSDPDTWSVVGHEGRHRMSIIRRDFGDIPVPITLEIRDGKETRARNITPEAVRELNTGCLDEDKLRWVGGPLFYGNYIYLNGAKVSL